MRVINPNFNATDMTFMLVATTLVMVMTPGLALFYGGLVGKKNAIAIMMQSFVAMGLSTVLWVVVGYSLCFSGDFHGVLGDLHNAFLLNISADTPSPVSQALPLYIFLSYQLMVVVITPPLITGAFTNRVRFKGYLLFLTLWQLFIYYPICHMVWGGGILQQWGVKDFGGGIVVHAIAGMSALAIVMYLGPRKFNDVAILAFLNTAIAGGFASFVWMIMDFGYDGKFKLVGFLTGGLAGLIVITPAAGYITPQAAMVLGIAAGFICYMAIRFKNSRKWDDALDVWGVHGIGGFLGIVLLGVFSTLSVNKAGVDGLLYGNPKFFGIEFGAVALASVYAFFITYAIFFVLGKVMTVHTSKKTEEQGLDQKYHGESAYGE
jgi:Amt family ammonium transporter